MNRFSSLSVGRRQQGISLLVVLLLLVVMSVLGVAVLRSSALQERMSANLRDRSLATQAVEAALDVARANLDAATKWRTTVPTAADCASDGILPVLHRRRQRGLAERAHLARGRHAILDRISG